MKTNYRLFVLALTICSLSVNAQSFTYNGINYEVTSTSPNEVKVANNRSYSGAAVIPSLVKYNSNTYAVTAIGEQAFLFCSTLTSITILESVETIGDYAFRGCIGLTSVTIPNSVETIGDYAFRGCSGLTGTLTIPNSVETIGKGTFYSCTSLESVMIPNSVKTIGVQAFYYCTSLVSVMIGNSVETIGEEAFYECSDLTSVTIGNSVETIGDYAFYGCSGLNSITIGNSVETIGNYAFSYCSGLTGTLTIPNSVTSIGRWAFDGCSGLTSVTIGNLVEAIGEWAFYGCSGLIGIDVAAGNLHYSSLDGVLFNEVQDALIQYPGGKAGSYIIPESVKTIGRYAFENCSKLTSVTICNSVETIGEGAFAVCESLTEVTIGNSVTAIGEIAFYKCSKLISVTIGNSVKTIGVEAFSYCIGLTGTLTIPNSVETIEGGAFAVCESLTEVTIGNSVTSIEEWAFSGCSGLTSVTIGNSVKTIGWAAFCDCSDLETIYVKAITPPVADYYTFDNVLTGIPVHVPCGRASAYQSAAEWSSFANYIEDLPLLNLTVQSEDVRKGTASITQANTCDNSTAVIAATPLVGYQFKQWSDGNTDNPRIVTVTTDTTFTAIFSGIDGTQATAFALYPNPVRDELFISGVSGEARIVISDLSGRTVGVKNISSLQTGEISINVSHLAKGVYLIKIGNYTGKIVKE